LESPRLFFLLGGRARFFGSIFTPGDAGNGRKGFYFYSRCRLSGVLTEGRKQLCKLIFKITSLKSTQGAAAGLMLPTLSVSAHSAGADALPGARTVCRLPDKAQGFPKGYPFGVSFPPFLTRSEKGPPEAPRRYLLRSDEIILTDADRSKKGLQHLSLQPPGTFSIVFPFSGPVSDPGPECRRRCRSIL